MFGDTACLTVNLDAIIANWRKVAAQAPKAECAAVVKADAYGLGAAEVAPALWRAGCRRFFVAHAEEALALRRHLADATIHALHGVPADAEAEYVQQRIVPVLSTPEQVSRWVAAARRHGAPLDAALQVDTGINRLGLQPREFDALLANSDPLGAFRLQFIMSHLACADEPDHPLNAEQASRFAAARARLPGLSGSFANSAGCFLGPAFAHDILRPGIALYGGNPIDPRATALHAAAQMQPVVELAGKILQIRDIDSAGCVGYGASYRVEKPSRIATVAVGYADGFLRALSNRGQAVITSADRSYQVPIAGRVSMDMITLDISALPADACKPGDAAVLLGGGIDLDAQAAAGGTISYELLTGLGPRYARRYLGGAA